MGQTEKLIDTCLASRDGEAMAACYHDTMKFMDRLIVGP